MLRDEFDGCLDVFRGSGVDADDRHAPLLAWNAEGRVEVAGLGRPVGKGVGLPVGELGSARLVRTPDAVVPSRADIRAGRVVTRSGWRHRVD